MSVDRAKYMGKDEVRKLRTMTEARAITDLRYGRVNGVLAWAVVDLAMSTGLRVSELVALKVQDVDLRMGALRVVRLKKRARDVETVAIDGKQCVQHLRAYLQWRADRLKGMDKANHKGLTDADGPLFVGQRGPLTNRGAQQAWKRAVALAGLRDDLSIHSARHTLATHLLRKCGNLRLVQKQLGHASPVTTANMYADVAFEDMQGRWLDCTTTRIVQAMEGRGENKNRNRRLQEGRGGAARHRTFLSEFFRESFGENGYENPPLMPSRE